MKILSRGLFLAIIGGALFANAANPLSVEACAKVQGQDKKTYISKISIFNESVALTYYSLAGENMGGMSGRALSMKVSADEIEIKNLTLNRQDSWIDGAYIKITKTTLTYDTPSRQDGPQARVACPADK